ncbi:MAG: hypothetical protein ACYTFG_05070 [Planctomycetota bacterium]
MDRSRDDRMVETEKLIEALREAVSEATDAEGVGDSAKAGAMFEIAADLASRLGAKAADLLLSEEGGEGEKSPQMGEGVQPAGLGPTEKEEPGAGAKTPTVLRWRSVEKDMRVFFYRNLPAMYETLRSRFLEAGEEGDWDTQWDSFRKVGDLLALMSSLKGPSRGML